MRAGPSAGVRAGKVGRSGASTAQAAALGQQVGQGGERGGWAREKEGKRGAGQGKTKKRGRRKGKEEELSPKTNFFKLRRSTRIFKSIYQTKDLMQLSGMNATYKPIFIFKNNFVLKIIL